MRCSLLFPLQGHTVTIFSASNYVDQVGNLGAFAKIDAKGTIDYIQFKAQPHPDMKPMHCESQQSRSARSL
jgi:hypothetical protein